MFGYTGEMGFLECDSPGIKLYKKLLNIDDKKCVSVCFFFR